MSSFHDTFALIAIWKTHTTPYVRKLLDKSIGNSRHMRMILASFNEYQVFEGHTRIFIDLKKKIILMRWMVKDKYFIQIYDSLCAS